MCWPLGFQSKFFAEMSQNSVGTFKGKIAHIFSQENFGKHISVSLSSLPCHEMCHQH